jgi:hypothetical protein
MIWNEYKFDIEGFQTKENVIQFIHDYDKKIENVALPMRKETDYKSIKIMKNWTNRIELKH